MYYSYVEIEYVATSFSPARTDLALKLLTLARLCGEWQLVSRNYKAWGASGGKYKAQIVIFRILAAVNKFSRISRKAESC